MTINLYSFVGIYSKALDTAAHLLAKGVEHAAATGASETDLLGWKLIDDMAPLAFQLMIVINFTRLWPARVVGLPLPAEASAEMNVAEFKSAIADAKAYLAALTLEAFAGRDDVPLTVTLGSGLEPTLPAGQWMTGFATTNIFFHLSTAYGILRSSGVKIGKIDLFPSGL